MTSDPWVLVPISVAFATMLLIGVAGILNLATAYMIRVPKRVPFPTIRRRELSMRDVLVPGLLALITGFLISLAAAFLFDGLTRGSDDAALTGLVIVACVIVGFSVIGAIWFKSGLEIGDLAKDPSTIAAAAKSLHGSSPDAAATLQILRRNHQDWEDREGALAFNPGTRRASPTASAALDRVMPRGRPPQRTRWVLLPALLRCRPLLSLPPIIAIAGLVISWIAIGRYEDSQVLEAAAMRATGVTVVVVALLATALLWWSELVCGARRYRVGQVGAVAAQLALNAAQRRITEAERRSEAWDMLAMSNRSAALGAMSKRIDRWGAIATALAVSAIALSLRRR